MAEYQGEKFQIYLKKNEISAIEVSEMLGVTRQNVYNYFKSKNLSRETVNSIVTGLKVNEEDIWGTIDDTPSFEIAFQEEKQEYNKKDTDKLPILTYKFGIPPTAYNNIANFQKEIKLLVSKYNMIELT